MAKVTGPRTVQCYLCRHRFEVSRRAQSTSCPGCHKAVIVEDFILKKNKPSLLMVTRVQTCGRIVIPRRTRVVAKLVEAHGGIEVLGHMDAQQVISGQLTVIGDKAHWKGNLKSPTVVIHERAVIEGGYFEVPDDSLELSTLPKVGDEPKPKPKPKPKAEPKTGLTPKPKPRPRPKPKPEPEPKTKPRPKPKPKTTPEPEPESEPKPRPKPRPRPKAETAPPVVRKTAAKRRRPPPKGTS